MKTAGYVDVGTGRKVGYVDVNRDKSCKYYKIVGAQCSYAYAQLIYLCSLPATHQIFSFSFNSN